MLIEKQFQSYKMVKIFGFRLEEALPMVEGEVIETLEEGEVVTEQAGQELVEGQVEGFEHEIMYQQEIPQYHVPGMQTYYTIPQVLTS